MSDISTFQSRADTVWDHVNHKVPTLQEKVFVVPHVLLLTPVYLLCKSVFWKLSWVTFTFPRRGEFWNAALSWPAIVGCLWAMFW